MHDLMTIICLASVGINAVMIVLAYSLGKRLFKYTRVNFRLAGRCERCAIQGSSYLNQIQNKIDPNLTGTVDMSLPMTLDPDGRTGEMIQKVGAA